MTQWFWMITWRWENYHHNTQEIKQQPKHWISLCQPPKRANGVTSVMHGYYYRLPLKGRYRHWLILCQFIKPVQRQFEWETTAFGLQKRALLPRKLKRTHEVQWCIVSWDLKVFFSEKLVFQSNNSLTYWACLVEMRSCHSSWKRKCSFFYVYIRSTYKALRLM